MSRLPLASPRKKTSRVLRRRPPKWSPTRKASRAARRCPYPKAMSGTANERHDRCPLDCALPFFDPLLTRAALVVEGDDILGRHRHVGDDEADAWIEFARMLFYLGDDPAWLRPASGLIGEIRIVTPHLVMRRPERISRRA
jgi:hypothetical protein